MNAKDKDSSTGNDGVGVSLPAHKRKMTIARYHRDVAASYHKSKMPDHYEELAQKHIKEAERIEAQVHAILRDEE